MHQWQITVGPNLESSRPLPEFIVFPSPADEGFIETADAFITLASDGDAATRFQVLHDDFRRPFRYYQPDLDLPAELKRREDRLAKIAEVKAEIERRAQGRYAQEQAEYEAKRAERAAKEQARGRKLGGKPPRAPTPVPGPTIKSISPMAIPGSCRWPVAASNKPTMRKRR